MKIVIDTTKNIIIKITLLGLFVILLVGVIGYARGYRINLNERKLTSTGIVSVSSNPKPAEVYINGELSGATDTNITLPYGQYTVEVRKEGYTSWKTDISLKGEIVMSLNAVLFSKNPSLTPLTNLGINSVQPVGNTDKIILVSNTGDVEKDGIYLFEPNSRPVTIFPPLKLLLLASTLPDSLDITTAKFVFNPNYRQAIVTFKNKIVSKSEAETETSYLISLNDENVELFEVTNSVENITVKWEEEKTKELRKILETLPKPLQKVASDSFHIVSLSPDEKKVMYLATADDELPMVINPPMIGTNQTKETRKIEKNSLYVYDKKEDKNFLIPVNIDLGMNNKKISANNPSDLTARILSKIKWYPTSQYLVYMEENKISTIQYDGTNKATVYAGPFDPTFFGLSPDWNLIVVINLNPQTNEFGDLYSVGIR